MSQEETKLAKPPEKISTRNARILEKYLKWGQTPQEIAKEELLPTKKISSIIKKTLEKIQAELLNHHNLGRVAHATQIRMVQQHLMPSIVEGNPFAIRIWAELQKQVAKVSGFNAPIKTELDVTTGGEKLTPEQQFTMITQVMGLQVVPDGLNLPFTPVEEQALPAPKSLPDVQVLPKNPVLEGLTPAEVMERMTEPDVVQCGPPPKDYVPMRLRK